MRHSPTLLLALACLLASCGQTTGDPGCGDCDDGVACTLDTCDQATPGCRHQPRDGDCPAGQVCDPARGCVEVAACASAAECDDQDACTLDSCDPLLGCTHAAVGCDDQDACTADTCDPATGCVHPQVACDDGDPCTTDTCDPATGCAHAQVACDDGDVCTTDACEPASGCSHALDCADPACAGRPECNGCQPVPEPAPVPSSPLPGEPSPGAAESTLVDGFHDDYQYSADGQIKIGTRREWGGTIVFFGMRGAGAAGMNATNTIDANDTGREVQVAFYDPDRAMQDCAWNASCASTPTHCANSITFLGWNPVQGGNRCNRGSGVDGVETSGGVLAVTTTPLFWNPNWDRQDCSSQACDDPQLRDRRSDVRVEQRLRFVDTLVVELDYTLTNLGDLEHRPAGQEMPTVYTANGHDAPDLWRLFDSSGTEIAIDQPANDGFFYKNFQSPGGWACMQQAGLDYGVGLYVENRNPAWQGWQLRALPFNNFRPLHVFGVPARGAVRSRAYLLIGALDTIRASAGWLDTHLPPFGWLDAPAADAALSGAASVGGWALDNKGVTAVELVVDGALRVPLAYGDDRPDVCRVWPGYAGCSQVGFHGTLDTAGLSRCPHLLEVEARDADGNARVIARRRVTVVD